MVLVESSAWILVLRGQAELPDDVLLTCPPIVQEVLQGAETPADYVELRRALLALDVLDDPMPLGRYEQAAELYLRCRAAAFTIRKGYDCLIAACAITHGVTLLHNDRDFDHIARVAPLRAVRITRS